VTPDDLRDPERALSGGEPSLFVARERLLWKEWLELRRRAAVTLTAVLPVVAAALAVSPSLLGERAVGLGEGVPLALVAGFLGGGLVCVARLVSLTATPFNRNGFLVGYPIPRLTLVAFPFGSFGGLAGGYACLLFLDVPAESVSFQPQALYMLALVCGILTAGWQPTLGISTPTERREN
jgi:hypothetical protein